MLPLFFIPGLAGFGWYLHASLGFKHLALFAIGIALGVTLFKGAFGFTGAYRKAITERDISGVTAQLLMIAIAIVLFAPVLAEGQIFGNRVSGALAPVSVSMALGAFIFGIGMQLGGSCASGTLFLAGGGNVRMILVLLFFCAGAFAGSLNLQWWGQLPGIGTISLGKQYGWFTSTFAQLSGLLLIYLLLRKFVWQNRKGIRQTAKGMWPLLLCGSLLALLNWVTLLVAGHAWSITWGFSLWGAKFMTLLGWDPAQSGFWSGRFQTNALLQPIWADNTSLMNIGILAGALLAGWMSKKIKRPAPIPFMSLLGAIIGGLMMGYGARLAYGCNIGAFFSGIASSSLHGWVWIACAIPGNFVGVKLRPLFRLSVP